MREPNLDFDRMCFVIMPFGLKPVGQARVNEDNTISYAGKLVDFDLIYDQIFDPAIRSVPLQEGGVLLPFRTDKIPASMNLDEAMSVCIRNARMVLADISGINPNVFWELGVRHATNESGTAIFRQSDAPIPFDIGHIKVMPYEYDPVDNIPKAQKLVSAVLASSLLLNMVDSPIRQLTQREVNQPKPVQDLLLEADRAVGSQDFATAARNYEALISLDPENALTHFKLGLAYKSSGRWFQAAAAFANAIEKLRAIPDRTGKPSQYPEAHRELGIALGKLPTAEEPLRTAIALNPGDFDAHSSLGGVLKRAGSLSDAADAYGRAVELSGGHPYPLLNELKLRARLAGTLTLSEVQVFQLKRAERFRLNQVKNPTPIDVPWSFFDLSEIQLYLGSKEGFLNYLHEGLLLASTQRWEVVTHRESLEGLLAAGYHPDGLSEGIALLKVAEEALKRPTDTA